MSGEGSAQCQLDGLQIETYGHCQSCCPGPNYHNDTVPWESLPPGESDEG